MKSVELKDLLRENSIPPELLKQKCSEEDLRIISGFIDWERVAPYLGLTDTEIDDIDCEERRGAVKRLKTLKMWKSKKGSRATYENLMKSFLKVGNADHAERVCRLLQPTESSIHNGDSLLSQGIVTISATDSIQSTIAEPSEHSHHTTAEGPNMHSIAESLERNIQNEIRELEDQFIRVVSKAQDYIETSKCLEKVKRCLAQLPISIKFQHIKFIRRKRSSIQKAKTVSTLFFILGDYWDFLNCGLLTEIIHQCGDCEIKQLMADYLIKLKLFRERTTLKCFADNWTGSSISTDFAAFPTKMDKKWDECTLENLENFRIQWSRQHGFKEYATSVVKVTSGCVTVIWGLHRSFPPTAALVQVALQFFPESIVQKAITGQKLEHPIEVHNPATSHNLAVSPLLTIESMPMDSEEGEGKEHLNKEQQNVPKQDYKKLLSRYLLNYLLIILCVAQATLIYLQYDIPLIPGAVSIKLNDVVAMALWALITYLCGLSIAGLYGILGFGELFFDIFNSRETQHRGLLGWLMVILAVLLTGASASYAPWLNYFIYVESTAGFNPLFQTLQLYPALFMVVQTFYQVTYLLQAYARRLPLRIITETNMNDCKAQLEANTMLNFTLLLHCICITEVIEICIIEKDIVLQLAVCEIVYRLWAALAFFYLRWKIEQYTGDETERSEEKVPLENDSIESTSSVRKNEIDSSTVNTLLETMTININDIDEGTAVTVDHGITTANIIDQTMEDKDYESKMVLQSFCKEFKSAHDQDLILISPQQCTDEHFRDTCTLVVLTSSHPIHVLIQKF